MIVALEDLELRVWHLGCERLKESRWDDPVVRTGKVALGNTPSTGRPLHSMPTISTTLS
jgi:hypothetical protein